MPDALSPTRWTNGASWVGRACFFALACFENGSWKQIFVIIPKIFFPRQTPTSCGRNYSKNPDQMLFPMLFIWPCFFIVALGPGMMIVMDALSISGASLWCELNRMVFLLPLSNSRLPSSDEPTNQFDAEFVFGKPIDTLTSDDPPVSEKKQSCVVMSLLEITTSI